MCGSNNFTNAIQITRKLLFKGLRVKGVVSNGNSLSVFSGEPILTVTMVLLIYLSLVILKGLEASFETSLGGGEVSFDSRLVVKKAADAICR